MILACPLCQTRYLVQAVLFAAGARQVRCARCKHSWMAEPPREIDVVAAPVPDPVPAPETAAPIPEGSNLPAIVSTPAMLLMQRLRLVGVPVMVALFGLWLIFDRQYIVRHFGFMMPVYNAINLAVYLPGDELEFDQVRSELKFEGGITKLILEGRVKNKTQNRQKIPPIIAEATGPDGQIIQSWRIDAPTARLEGGEEVPFTSSLNAPKGSVANVNLTFAETKDDD